MTARRYVRRAGQLLRAPLRGLPQRLRTLPPRQTALVVAGAVLGAGTAASALASAWQAALASLGLLSFLLVVAVQQVRRQTVLEYAAVRDALYAERRAAAEREQAQAARYEEAVQWLARLDEQHRRLLGALERERLDAADFRAQMRARGDGVQDGPTPDDLPQSDLTQDGVSSDGPAPDGPGEPGPVATQVPRPRQQMPRGSAG